MLSSTFTDLREHRQRAIEASKLGYMPGVMEHSGAQAEADVIDTSLQMVRDAALASTIKAALDRRGPLTATWRDDGFTRNYSDHRRPYR
jgi:hypothetical protein